MIGDRLPTAEQDVLNKILAHHGVHDDELTKHLAQLGNWIRQDERDKVSLHRMSQAPYLIVLMSQMGLLTPKEKIDG